MYQACCRWSLKELKIKEEIVPHSLTNDADMFQLQSQQMGKILRLFSRFSKYCFASLPQVCYRYW